MDYGQLIAQAWRLVLHNRFLWGLAVIAGCQGGMGLPTTGFNFGDFSNAGPDLERGSRELSQDTEQFTEAVRWLEANIGLLLSLVAIFLLLVIAYWVVSTIASAGVMSAVGSLEVGTGTGFGVAWRQGAGVFWRFLGLGLLFLLIMLVTVALGALLVAVPFIAGSTNPDGVGLFLWFAVLTFLLIVIGIPLFVVASVLSVYAQRAIILDGDGVFASIGRAAALLRTRLGPSLLLWLISLGLSIGVGFAVIFLLILLAIPIAIVLIVLGAISGPLPTIAIGVPLGLLALAALWFVGSLSGAFLSAYWTLAYLKLTRPQVTLTTPAI